MDMDRCGIASRTMVIIATQAPRQRQGGEPRGGREQPFRLRNNNVACRIQWHNHDVCIFGEKEAGNRTSLSLSRRMLRHRVHNGGIPSATEGRAQATTCIAAPTVGLELGLSIKVEYHNDRKKTIMINLRLCWNKEKSSPWWRLKGHPW